MYGVDRGEFEYTYVVSLPLSQEGDKHGPVHCSDTDNFGCFGVLTS
jgi:hypothetical protein